MSGRRHVALQAAAALLPIGQYSVQKVARLMIIYIIPASVLVLFISFSAPVSSSQGPGAAGYCQVYGPFITKQHDVLKSRGSTLHM